MRAALELQLAQFSRALTTRVATAVIVMAPLLFALGFVALARSGAVGGANAAQFAAYAEGSFASAAAQLAGQMMCVWTLIAAGFVISWSIGREWSDGTYGSLFALPVTRTTIAWAKVAVTAGWCAVAVTLASALVATGIAVVDGEHLDAAVATQLVRVWAAGLIMVALALPFGAVAALFRGYLGAVAAIIAATAASQILGTLGLGSWTPLVAPAVWAGAAGPEAAAAVGVASLLGALAAAAAGVAALVWVFGRGRLD